MVKIVRGATEAGIWDRLSLFLREPRGIQPSNDLRRAVHLCSIVAGVWTSIISPFLFAFPLQVEQGSGPRVWASWAPVVIIIGTLCDATLSVETLLCFCTAFNIHSSQGAFARFEKRILHCGRRYLRTWAFLDIFSALPAALVLFLLLAANKTQGVWVVQIILILKFLVVIRLKDKLVGWALHKSGTPPQAK